MENTSLLIQCSPDELHGIVRKAVQDAVEQLKTKLSQQEYNPLEKLTRRQVKEEYKISYPVIHTNMNNGKLPFEKLGNRTYFLRKDVENLFTKKSF